MVSQATVHTLPSHQRRNPPMQQFHANGFPKTMASMADHKQPNYNSRAAYGTGNNVYANQYAVRNQTNQGYGMHYKPNHDMTSLAHSLQGVNIQNPALVAQAKNPMMSHHGNSYAAHSAMAPMPAAMFNPSAPYMFPNGYNATGNGQSPGLYTPHAAPHMSAMPYAGYRPHENSPLSQNWTPTTGAAVGEIPNLITPRRDSISSNENDQPTTPLYTGYPSFAHHTGVLINRSPSGMYAQSTPSPGSMISPYNLQMTKQIEQSDVAPYIKTLIAQEPAIPRAIPAPSSPLKPLDRALENQRGETNVYIRGLLPDTSDEKLEAWGRRFGDIKSSKSIIDLNNGQCKGYGFIKYHNYEDAENCIRGFHYLGYEVSFARESFYSKLKTFADESNTNLYVSNLPKSMNEHELAILFEPHKVCSSRILRDRNGHGRGVGFARFESREVCEEVIKSYNNYTIKTNDDELQIQIRFADTQEQKALKQQTQAARHFRSQEYEIATQEFYAGRLPLAGTTPHTSTNNGSDNTSNEFDQYLGTTPSVPIQSQRWAQSAIRSGPGRSPLGGVPINTSSAPAPVVQTNVASGHENQHPSGDKAIDVKRLPTSPVTAERLDPVDSVTASDQD